MPHLIQENNFKTNELPINSLLSQKTISFPWRLIYVSMISLFFCNISISAPMSYVREITHDISGYKTLALAKEDVINILRIDLLNELGVSVYSETTIKQNSLGRNIGSFELKAVSAGIIKTEIIHESRTGDLLYLKARLVADPEKITSDLGKLAQLLSENRYLQEKIKNYPSDKSAPQNSAGNVSAEEIYLTAIFHLEKGNNKRSIELLKKSSEMGYIKSAAKLGAIYYFGEIVKTDLTESENWLNIASSGGDENSKFILGTLLYARAKVSHDQHDVKKSISLFNELTKSKYYSEFSHYILGEIYSRGVVIGVDDKKALTHFEQSANQGSVYAAEEVARYYENGSFINKNPKYVNDSLMLKWLARAGVLGSQDSAMQLALLHSTFFEKSKEYEKYLNDEEAVKWLTMLVSKYKDPDAMMLLSAHYKSGAGVERNLDRHLMLLRMAANQTENLRIAELAKRMLKRYEQYK